MKVDRHFCILVPASLGIGVELTIGVLVVVDTKGASGGDAVLENWNPIGSSVS